MVRGSLFFVAAIALILNPAEVLAQTSDGRRTGDAGAFLGGSILLSSISGTETDPLGFGYLRPYFHGSLDWPAAGALLDGGVFIGRHWSIGGELALRRPQSAVIVEQIQSGHTEYVELFSKYTDREWLMSGLVRYHALAHRRVGLQPLGGLTLSHSTAALTNRRGTKTTSLFGTLARFEPDVSVSATRLGLGAGADVVFRTSRNMAVCSGARVHWIQRPHPLVHTTPAPGPWILSVNVGLIWNPRI